MTLLHLVAHDGSAHGEDALALARTLGAGRDVRRSVVHVVVRRGPSHTADAAALAVLGEEDRAHVARIRGALAADEELEVVLAQSAARGLHHDAEARGAEVIVIGAGHDAPAFGLLHTSPVAGALLAGGPTAVALAPTGHAGRAGALGRIVVGFDDSAEAHAALAEAAALAVGAGAMVDVVHVYAAPVEAYPMGGSDRVRAEDPHDPRGAAIAVAEAGREALPASVRGEAVGCPGAPGPALEAYAARREADLIVLGSRAYGPLRRVLLGSVGRHVLHHAACPVLVLPRGTRASVPPGAEAFAVAP